MSGTRRSSTDLDIRRRRALFRSWHRGMREMDLVFGRFADAEISDLSNSELGDFELLLDAIDRDVFMWLTDEIAVPEAFDTPLYRRIKDFCAVDGAVAR
jgi:antitoxin CptB